jgi:hypothetical protein
VVRAHGEPPFVFNRLLLSVYGSCTAYGPDTQSETGFRKAPRPIADKTALICGNYKGDSRGVTNWSLLAGMEWWRTCA